MAKQQPPVPLPLQEMARHVAYEVGRLEFAASQREFMENNERGGLIREAFLIHFRNLLDFFYGSKTFATDALADDYMDSSSAWTPNVTAWWNEDKIRCNKLLAHLTYERVEYEKSGELKWKRDFISQTKHIQDEWRAFLAALTAERKAWFRSPEH